MKYDPEVKILIQCIQCGISNVGGLVQTVIDCVKAKIEH